MLFSRVRWRIAIPRKRNKKRISKKKCSLSFCVIKKYTFIRMDFQNEQGVFPENTTIFNVIKCCTELYVSEKKNYEKILLWQLAQMANIFIMTATGMAIIMAIGPYWAPPLQPSESQIPQVPDTCAPNWHTRLAVALFSAHRRERWPVSEK